MRRVSGSESRAPSNADPSARAFGTNATYVRMGLPRCARGAAAPGGPGCVRAEDLVPVQRFVRRVFAAIAVAMESSVSTALSASSREQRAFLRQLVSAPATG